MRSSVRNLLFGLRRPEFVARPDPLSDPRSESELAGDHFAAKVPAKWCLLILADIGTPQFRAALFFRADKAVRSWDVARACPNNLRATSAASICNLKAKLPGRSLSDIQQLKFERWARLPSTSVHDEVHW